MCRVHNHLVKMWDIEYFNHPGDVVEAGSLVDYGIFGYTVAHNIFWTKFYWLVLPSTDYLG